MAKKIDTRNEAGEGLTYTEYDIKMEDWAKAPKTRLDGKFKIKQPKIFERPGEVKYYGSSFKKAAEDLNKQRFDAYERRQTNEYIRTGSAAPGEKIERSKVAQGELQRAKTDFGSRIRGIAEEGTNQLNTQIEEARAAATSALASLGSNLANTSGNFKTATKSFRSFANFRNPDSEVE